MSDGLPELLIFDLDEEGNDNGLVPDSSSGTVSSLIGPAFNLNRQQAVTETQYTVGTLPKGITREDFSIVTSAVYQEWTAYKALPEYARVEALTGVRAGMVKKIMDSDEFADAVIARGVPWRNTGVLSAQQMLVAQIVTNPTDRRDLRKKLRSAGVTYAQYRAWMAQPRFSQYMNSITEGMLIDHLPDFNTVLTAKGMAGDLNAIKYINELSGRHDPNRQQVQDLQLVVQNLLEIIFRNVKDPEVMQAISAEFQMVMNTGRKTVKGELGA